MLSTVLVFAVILSLSGSISLLFHKRIEICIPVSVALVICILYLFGLFGLLGAGVYVVLLLSLIGLFFWLRAMIKQRSYGSFLTPGVAVYFLVFLLAWWANRGRMLTVWDEFSHWGLVVKNMFFLGSFASTPAATTYFKDYPPSAAIFQYFFTRVSGSFQEANLYRAMNILYFSLMMPVFSRTKWKKPAYPVVLFAILLVLPIVFYPDFYTSILVDGLLGVLFGCVLYSYFSSELDRFTLINLSLSLVVLALMKKSGAGLAVLAMLIIGTDLLIGRKAKAQAYLQSLGRIKRWAVLLAPVLSVGFALITWKLYMMLYSVTGTFGLSGLNLSNMAALFIHHTPPYRVAVFSNFIKALTNVSITSGIVDCSFVVWLVLLSAPVLTLLAKETDPLLKRSVKTAAIGLFTGAVVYGLSLVLLYAFVYPQYEAAHLASYARYMGTYLLGMAVFLIPLLLFQAETRLHFKSMQAGCLVLFFLLLSANAAPLFDMTLLAQSANRQTEARRAPYQALDRLAGEMKGKQEKVFFLSIADRGYDYWVCRYTLTPVPVQSTDEGWSIGVKPYFEGDVWTKAVSPELWALDLKNGYRYVYIYKTDGRFAQDYQSLFQGGLSAIKENTLYQVVISQNTVSLRAVNSAK